MLRSSIGAGHILIIRVFSCHSDVLPYSVGAKHLLSLISMRSSTSQHMLSLYFFKTKLLPLFRDVVMALLWGMIFFG